MLDFSSFFIGCFCCFAYNKSKNARYNGIADVKMFCLFYLSNVCSLCRKGKERTKLGIGFVSLNFYSFPTFESLCLVGMKM